MSKVEGWPPRLITPTVAKDRQRGDGENAATFIETYCRIVKDSVGGSSGELIHLRPWQQELINWLLARRADGKRKHRQALIGLPRKSGKSALLSGLALYELMLGPEGGEAFTVATTRDQARIVFGTTKRMVEMDPELMSMTKLFRDAIEFPETGSVFRVMAAEAPQLEGLNPSFVIVDEVHALPNRELWDVLSLAMAARTDPQMVGITTAGVKFDRFGAESLCYSMYNYGERVASKEIEDHSFGLAWWQPKDPKADHRDPKVWAEANPGLGDIQSLEDFEAAVQRTPESEFRTKRLNLWVDSSSTWLPEGAWDGVYDSREVNAGDDVVLALDGSFNGDSTALVGVRLATDEDDKPHVFVVDAWERPPNSQDEWSVDILEVEDAIRQAAKTYNVKEVACDPYRWARTMQILAEERLPIVEFPQSAQRMSPATTRMYEAVMNETITHDGDLRLARHISAAVLKVDNRGSRLVKESRGTSRKIDLAVCAVMALDRAEWWSAEGRKPVRRTYAF